MGTGFTIALLVHAGLVAALAYGVAWRRQDVNTVSAELWAAVPQIAAPMAAPPPPPAPPAPAPAPRPAPAPPPPAPAQKADADIAIKKAQKDKADKEKAEKEKAEKLKAEKEKAERDKADKLKADKLKADKDKAIREEADRKKAALEKAKADKVEQDRLARQRLENIERMNRQLGTDNPAVGNNPGPSSGRAAVSAAPSASYAGRIRARVLPNIVYAGSRDLPIVAEVEVKVAPDGKIMGTRLVKSSGNPDWDQAVQRALVRADVLPPDTDGRVPPVMLLSFDPTQR
ncbi:MAG: hypothetical protein RLZZ524_2146 [Pseudomonadota bacterium]